MAKPAKTPIKPVSNSIDWESIERDYRAGILSVREIAASHGITHGAINKRAKRDAWERNLKAKIMARAEALVSRQEVSKTVSAETLATDEGIVAAGASVVANVLVGQRQRIARQTEMVELLTEQLILAIGNREALEQAIEDETASDKDGRRRSTLMKAVSLSGHASTAANLTNALKTVTAMQRQAYNIVDEPTQVDPLSALLKQVSGSTLPVITETHDE